MIGHADFRAQNRGIWPFATADKIGTPTVAIQPGVMAV
jgi:hypothetical protein